MPNYQTLGIVIGRTNFGEADRIIRLVTPEQGKLAVVAKGIRKIKSRSAGHLELFGEVALVLATGRNLDVVTSARLGWYPHELIQDYRRLGLAYAFAGIIDRVAADHQPQAELYHHLREALINLNAGAQPVLIELWFKLRLLYLAGFRPELTVCVSCGQSDPDRRYFFEADRGGITCDRCASAIARPIDQNTIKLWRLLTDYSYATIAHIAGAEALAEHSLPLCDEFYEHHLGRAFHPGII